MNIKAKMKAIFSFRERERDKGFSFSTLVMIFTKYFPA
jgi:hypothetical protein